MINVTTRIGELKTHSLILNRLRQAISARDFSLIVIFPTLGLLEAIQSEFLDQPGIDGFGGCRLLLFQGFQDEVCGLFGMKYREPAPLVKEILITQCFRRLSREEKLPYLGRVPLTRNYRRAILQGIAEWNRAGLTPAVFEAWAAGKGERLRELQLLYREYQQLLTEHGFITEDLVLTKLETHPSPRVRKQGTVIFYGFTDLTPIQSKYFEALSPWYEMEMVVDPTPVFEFQEWVARHFAILPGLTPFEESSVFHASSDTTLGWLQQNLWAPRPVPWTIQPADNSVRLIQAAGAVRTATGIAREIASLIRDHPEYGWDDFLIIAPQPPSFIKNSRPVFREYGIPLTEAAAPLREFPQVSHWLQAFIAAGSNWSWPEMEILIRQSYPGTQAAIGDRILLEIGRKYGALSGRERWLGITKSDSFGRYFTEIGLDLQPLLLKIAWLDKIPEVAPLQDYLQLTLEWIGFFALKKEQLQDTGESFMKQAANYRAGLFFREAVLEFAHLTGRLMEFQDPLSVGEFERLITDYVLTLEVEGASGKEIGPRILPPREARGLKARVVFITGLEEGVFPGIYINDWKITVQERRELKNRGIRLETAEQYQLQEKLAFYWGLQAATERLYLVFQDQDDEAQPLNRSVFLEDVLQCLPELASRSVQFSLAPSLPDSLAACEPVEKVQFWAYKLTAAASSMSEEERETHRRLLGDSGYRSLALQILQWRERLMGLKTPFFALPESWRLLNKLYHAEYAFAITALEDFRRCSYRFYFRHLLKVLPVFKPQLFPSALDLGDLYHQILQEFGDNYREQSLTPENQPEYQKYLDDCFQSFFREWLENAPNDPVKLILMLKSNEIRRNLRSWLAAEVQQATMLTGRFRIKNLELAFGVTKGDFDPDSTSRPFSCEFEDQKVSLWGKVDRVDQDSNGNFLVYDYKSGKTPSIQNILKIENFQLPVYIMAMEQLFFGAGRAAGGSYLGLRHTTRNRSGVWRHSEGFASPAKLKILNEAEWQDWLTAVRKALVDTVQSIRRGEFQRRTDKCLEFCEYGVLCHRREGKEGSSD